MNKYYVYCFSDPTKPGKYYYEDLDICFLFEPFYIGKGSGNRMKAHFYPKSLEEAGYKNNKIKNILNNGNFVIMEKLFENLDEKISLEKEQIIISKIGRKDLKKGPLCNLTDGGENGLNYNNKNKKPIIQYDKNGNIIKHWNSILEATNELNLSKGLISSCCSKKIQSYKNYVWCYKKDEFSYIENSICKKVIRYYNDNSTKVYNSVKEAASDLGLKSSNLTNYLKGDSANKKLNMAYYDKQYDSIYKTIRDSKKINAGCKPIIQLSLNGDFIKYWNSASHVEKENKWSASTILSCCKGRKKTAYKYKWIYKNNEK